MLNLLKFIIYLVGFTFAFSSSAEESRSAIIHRALDLKLSPSGKYVYFRSARNAITLFETSCLTSKTLKECHALPISPSKGLYFSGVGFDAKENPISFYPPLDNSRISNDKITFEAFDLSSGNSKLVTYDLKGRNFERIFDYFQFDFTSKHDLIQKISNKNADFFKIAKNIQLKNRGLRARNIYGIVSNENSFFISVENDKNLKGCFNSNPCVDMGVEGKAIKSYTDNIKFAILNGRVYFETIGTIFRQTHGGVVETVGPANLSAFLISSPDNKFKGYFTRDIISIEPRVGKIVQEISIAVKKEAIQNLYNVAISGDNSTAIIMWSNSLNENEICYNITVVNSDGYHNLPCGGMRTYTKSTSFFKSLTVKHYKPQGSKGTVVYIHGGPYSNVDINNSFLVHLLVLNGFSVDVVEYSGADETYEVLDRLSKKGSSAIASDAEALSEYVRSKSSQGELVSLYVESFGARLLRYIPVDTFEFLDKLILDMPAGYTEASFNSENPVVYSLYKAILGKFYDDMAIENAYFEDLKECQLKRNFLLMVGRNDNRVNPLFDYRNCFKPRMVDLYVDDFNHGDSYRYLNRNKVLLDRYNYALYYLNGENF